MQHELAIDAASKDKQAEQLKDLMAALFSAGQRNTPNQGSVTLPHIAAVIQCILWQ